MRPVRPETSLSAIKRSCSSRTRRAGGEIWTLAESGERSCAGSAWAGARSCCLKRATVASAAWSGALGKSPVACISSSHWATWSIIFRQSPMKSDVEASPLRTADSVSSTMFMVRDIAEKSTIPAQPFSVWKVRKTPSSRSFSSGACSSASNSLVATSTSSRDSTRNCSRNSFISINPRESRRASRRVASARIR